MGQKQVKAQNTKDFLFERKAFMRDYIALLAIILIVVLVVGWRAYQFFDPIGYLAITNRVNAGIVLVMVIGLLIYFVFAAVTIFRSKDKHWGDK